MIPACKISPQFCLIPLADFDECEYDNAGCEQICTNSIPGYQCECYDGYRLDANGVNCTSEYAMLNLVQNQQRTSMQCRYQ